MAHDINFIGYLDNTLSEPETKQVKDHLAFFTECREALGGLEKDKDLFTRISKQYLDLLTFDINVSAIHKVGNFALSESVSLPGAIENRLAYRYKQAQGLLIAVIISENIF